MIFRAPFIAVAFSVLLSLGVHAQTHRIYRISSNTNSAIETFSGNGFVTWSSAAIGGKFVIEGSSDLGTNLWIPVTRGIISNTVMSVRVQDFNAPAGFAFIPGGTYWRGDFLNDLQGQSKPVHEVTVNPFYLGKCEVTNGEIVPVLQWAYDNGRVYIANDSIATNDVYIYNAQGTPQPLFSLYKYNSEIRFDNGKFSHRAGRERFPCVWVSWYGSAATCNFLSEMKGLEPAYNLTNWVCDFSKRAYRLPTDAEWERAARGGWENKRFPWGGDDLITHERANYKSSTSNVYDVSKSRDFHPVWAKESPRTNPVDYFPPNEFGLHDMAGNNWEWVYDWADRYFSTALVNPTGPTNGTFKVFRGGSWFTTAERLTCAMRYTSMVPGRTFDDFGFRLLLPYPAP